MKLFQFIFQSRQAVQTPMRAELNQIPCIKCGNCCPIDCDRRIGNECSVHPSRIGKEASDELRGQGCYLTPAALVTWDYYCPPVVEKIEQLTGVRAIPVRRYGVVQIKNVSQLSRAYRPLLGLKP